VNAKAKGSRNERRSRALLEAAGYQVIRAAASLGHWDLVGVSSVDIVLCQVKTRDWPSAVEIEHLQATPAPGNARKLIHRWRERQRVPDVRDLSS
jgi:Holliday junction resolvase